MPQSVSAAQLLVVLLYGLAAGLGWYAARGLVEVASNLLYGWASDLRDRLYRRIAQTRRGAPAPME